MKNAFKIATITGCLISFCYGNVPAAEDSITKQQQEISNRVCHGMWQENWQAYIGTEETPRKQKLSRHEKNKKYGKQEPKGKALKVEEKDPFAMHFLSEKIERAFKHIVHNGNTPRHEKLTKLIEDIKQEPWALKGEGKPEILKGRYKGIEGCYSRRINKGNRLVYKVNDGSVMILACEGHYK